MVIIETEEELHILKEKISNRISYWFPMWVDWDLHPMNNSLSFLFINCDGVDYILSHNHTDTLSIDLRGITKVLNTEGGKWVFQKKKLLQSLKITNNEVWDIDTAHFLETHTTIDYKTPFNPLLSFYLRNGYTDNLIKYCPILKLGEIIQSFIEKYKSVSTSNPNFEWYNQIYIPILSKIEEFGIKVDLDKFRKRWPTLEKMVSPNSYVYTEYNPYTTTGRPSNRYGGINFSALNKNDGTREVFISDGIFIQMDYDAYHPRIIGKLINYELPSTSVHQWLADQYGCSYDEGKGVTFQLLYGGIPEEFLSIPYYKLVDEHIKSIWESTQRQGYLQTIKRKIPLSWIESPNPQKVFNYLLQAIETELNVDKLEKIMELIDGTNIKLCLYTYDSFLLDYPLELDTQFAKEIKILIDSGGFPTKVNWGTDYSKI